jgi:hypothetical protein
MRFLTRKKGVAFLATLIVAAVAAFGAYAYFTSTGSGTGSATVGSSAGITLSGSPAAQLFPGGADAPVTVSIHNPGGGKEYVGTISGTVADNGGCLGSWFTVDPVGYNASVAAGATVTTATNVRMTDSGTSQDACQGKTMTISWASN